MKTCDCFSWALDHDWPHCIHQKWKVEVIADRSGKWCGNGLTFETFAAAEGYAKDLFMRWTAVREWRVVSA